MFSLAVSPLKPLDSFPSLIVGGIQACTVVTISPLLSLLGGGDVESDLLFNVSIVMDPRLSVRLWRLLWLLLEAFDEKIPGRMLPRFEPASVF